MKKKLSDTFRPLTYEKYEPIKNIRTRYKLKEIFNSSFIKDYREKKRQPHQRFQQMYQDGVIDTAKPVAIYAHYNACDTVSEMVCQQLAALKENDYQIIFVSMSGLYDRKSLEQLKTLATHIITRQSFGRDFGAWRDIWLHYRDTLTAAQEILFINDSVIGPIKPLKPLIESMREHTGLIGLTENSEPVPHLQSYFLMFRGTEAISTLDKFMQTLKLSYNKNRMINHGEIALSQYFRTHGIPVYVAFPNMLIFRHLFSDKHEMQKVLFAIAASFPAYTNQLFQSFDDEKKWRTWLPFIKSRIKSNATNVTHYYWKILIDKLDYPFIKTELLSRNPSGICGLEEWHDVIGKESDMTLQTIEEHLFMVV